jgi:hypothetical protein
LRAHAEVEAAAGFSPDAPPDVWSAQ